ncbi:MAG TPA: PEGA domain-containing protein [Humisphaera sp.]
MPFPSPLARSVRRSLLLLTGGALAAAGGCVERELVVESDPPGALVYMNDQEVGRTPFKREFEWYGTYDVTLRQEGYETVKDRTPVIAPVWMWVPFDLVAEILPFRLTDTHRLTYTMTPAREAGVEPASIIDRGRDLRTELESGQKTTTRPASATRPSSRPTTRRGGAKPAATRPATQP